MNQPTPDPAWNIESLVRLNALMDDEKFAGRLPVIGKGGLPRKVLGIRQAEAWLLT